MMTDIGKYVSFAMTMFISFGIAFEDAPAVYARMAAHDSTHWWYRARRDILHDYVARYAGLPRQARILEIGCGTGHNLPMLQRFGEVDAIEIDPAARQQQAQRVTILLHKPIGYVSGQAEDGYEPASVLVKPEHHWAEDPSRKPFHPGHARGLAPAGRLDIDSTGLLVLTQDGRVAKRLIGDETRVEKEYLVRVAPLVPGPMPDNAVRRLSHGLELDGVKLREARVSWQNEDQLRIVLREGR